MIWKFVLGDARVKVKEVNYKTGPTPEDYTGNNEQLRKMSPPDSHTRAYVTTYPGELLDAFTTLRCIKTVKNEFESTFFKFVLFDGKSIFPMAPLGPLSIDTSRIKRLHTEPRCLGDILRVRYSLITDYTTASNHRVILPDFRALEYLSIREFCGADVYHSQDYDSRFPHVTKLMHFKRMFEVDVSIGVQGECGTICEAFVTKEKLRSEYRDSEHRSAKLEEHVRNKYGLWEEDSVRDILTLKLALERPRVSD